MFHLSFTCKPLVYDIKEYRYVKNMSILYNSQLHNCILEINIIYY